jgi:DNA gyrase subunit A
MIINRSGVTIRMHIADLRVLGRATQGVKLINLRGKDAIASITKVDSEPEEIENGTTETENATENAIGENLTPTETEGETPQDNNTEN